MAEGMSLRLVFTSIVGRKRRTRSASTGPHETNMTFQVEVSLRIGLVPFGIVNSQNGIWHMRAQHMTD